MIVVFMDLVQYHTKIASIQPVFPYTPNFHAKAGNWQAVKRPAQRLLICAQIQQCRHKHITADACITL